jgi:hypothetical protein
VEGEAAEEGDGEEGEEEPYKTSRRNNQNRDTKTAQILPTRECQWRTISTD